MPRTVGALWPVVVLALLGCFGARAEGCAIRDVHSRHFLIHTDLSLERANELVERLEAMLAQMATYWGQPLHGTIECYVIRNLDEFPLVAIAPAGVCAVKTFGGVTLMEVNKEGKRQVAKSVVCCSARFEVLRHEVVHAYCHQTFGRIGPVWYSEGMAEMGRFWKDGDAAVRAEPRKSSFFATTLQNRSPRPFRSRK